MHVHVVREEEPKEWVDRMNCLSLHRYGIVNWLKYTKRNVWEDWGTDQRVTENRRYSYRYRWRNLEQNPPRDNLWPFIVKWLKGTFTRTCLIVGPMWLLRGHLSVPGCIFLSVIISKFFQEMLHQLWVVPYLLIHHRLILMIRKWREMVYWAINAQMKLISSNGGCLLHSTIKYDLYKHWSINWRSLFSQMTSHKCLMSVVKDCRHRRKRKSWRLLTFELCFMEGSCRSKGQMLSPMDTQLIWFAQTMKSMTWG